MRRFVIHLTICSVIWGTINLSATNAYADPAPAASESAEHKLPEAASGDNPYKQRRDIYDKLSALTGIPWYRLAAVDQYERTLTKANAKKREHPDRVIGVFVEQPKWTGMLNPDPEDQNPKSISMFHGLGKDGSGDSLADRNNDIDLLYSVSAFIGSYGIHEDDFAVGLWNYYKNSRAVQRVLQFSRLYEHFDRIQLHGSAFPLPVNATYSYRSTWGMGRHYGGFRIHEGTDIFAPHGVPVRSTCFGIVEVKGWNRYGGWRIGIRDINNLYHYYAHLSGYNKTLNQGDIVTPGQVIGWVGSSGYGKPGTSGKFPPHLHYGVYRDRGLVEYAFDPYPLLKKWENDEKRTLRAAQQKKSN